MSSEVEQALVFIEVKASQFAWKHLEDQGLYLDQGWHVVSTTISGAGQSDYRSFGIVVLLERPRRKPKVEDEPQVLVALKE